MTEADEINANSSHLMGSLKAVSHFFIAIGVAILSAVLFSVIGAAIVKLIYGISFIDMAAYMTGSNPTPGPLRVFQGITAIGIFIFSTLVLVRIYKVKGSGYLHLSKTPSMKHVGLGVLFLIATIPVIASMLQFNQSLDLNQFFGEFGSQLDQMDKQNDDMYKLLMQGTGLKTLLINLFVMALIPAVGEELLFRGIFLNTTFGFTKNIHGSIFIVSLMFTLIHLQIAKFLPMMFLAVSLGYLAYFTGSLWLPILVHFLNNAIAVLGGYLTNSGVENAVLTDDFQFSWPVVLGRSTYCSQCFFYIVQHQ